MDLFDILRKFFVGSNLPNQDWQRRNNFRNPIWRNDEDDDDDDDGDFRNRNRNQDLFGDSMNVFNNGHFSIDIGPIDIPVDILRQFTKSMDEFRNFFHGFHDDSFAGFMDPHFHPDSPLRPQIEPPNQSLRDKFLKPNIPSREPIRDVNLDGKVTPENLTKLWKDSESPPVTEPFSRMPQLQKCIRSVITNVVNGPNGSEMRKTVVDCDGNTTTTIKKKVGDKVETIIIENGKETRKEELVETDQNQPPLLKDSDPNSLFPSEPLNQFPWSKYFGPKL